MLRTQAIPRRTLQKIKRSVIRRETTNGGVLSIGSRRRAYTTRPASSRYTYRGSPVTLICGPVTPKGVGDRGKLISVALPRKAAHQLNVLCAMTSRGARARKQKASNCPLACSCSVQKNNLYIYTYIYMPWSHISNRYVRVESSVHTVVPSFRNRVSTIGISAHIYEAGGTGMWRHKIAGGETWESKMGFYVVGGSSF